MYNNLYLNAEKIINNDIYKINDKNYIQVKLLEKRGNKYYDVIFVNGDKEKFLGRFAKGFDLLKVSYKDGKILVYYDEFFREEGINQMKVKKVLSLYDILDDVFYACSEKEALTMFDKSLSTDKLISEDNKLIRVDTEKKKRI